MSASEVLIGVYGWEGRDWCDGFFPEDLPRDWRLEYCSNVLRLMVVPADQVQAADCDALEHWSEALDDGLVLLLEGPVQHPQQCDGAEGSGFVTLEKLGQQEETSKWTWKALNPEEGGPSLLALSFLDEVPAPAITRRTIEDLVAAAPDGATVAWVLDGKAAMAVADQARMLVEMMGL